MKKFIKYLTITLLLLSLSINSQNQKVYKINELPITQIDTIIQSAVLIDITKEHNIIEQYQEGILDWKAIYSDLENNKKYKLIIKYEGKTETYFLW